MRFDYIHKEHDYTGADGSVSIANKRLVRETHFQVAYNPDDPDVLTVQKDDDMPKRIRIEKSYEWSLKCMKTKIKANDGAAGLYQDIYKSLITEHFLEGLYIKALYHMADIMKAA